MVEVGKEAVADVEVEIEVETEFVVELKELAGFVLSKGEQM